MLYDRSQRYVVKWLTRIDLLTVVEERDPLHGVPLSGCGVQM